MPSLLEFRRVLDRKSTRLNSSHTIISYAVFCLKKKKQSSQSHETRTTPRPHLARPPHTHRTRDPPGRVSRNPPTMVDWPCISRLLFFFNDRAPPEIYPLSLHDPLPISRRSFGCGRSLERLHGSQRGSMFRVVF